MLMNAVPDDEPPSSWMILGRIWPVNSSDQLSAEARPYLVAIMKLEGVTVPPKAVERPHHEVEVVLEPVVLSVLADNSAARTLSRTCLWNMAAFSVPNWSCMACSSLVIDCETWIASARLPSTRAISRCISMISSAETEG